MKNFRFILYIFVLVTLCGFPGCNEVDDERIPNMPVNISIADAGMWNTYGVAGFGTHREFIISAHIPASFPYSTKNATGFGGVLLIEGLDPFTGNSSVPMAYDLACPVERKSDVRVSVSNDTYMAICPQCGSSYDVTMQRGAPVGGVAATGKYKYALKSYSCLPSGTGGYYITN